MPIYEYTCQTCEHHFETLVRTGDVPECPKCRSLSLAKTFSVFAVKASSAGLPECEAFQPGACGSCGDPRGPGACALN